MKESERFKCYSLYTESGNAWIGLCVLQLLKLLKDVSRHRRLTYPRFVKCEVNLFLLVIIITQVTCISEQQSNCIYY